MDGIREIAQEHVVEDPPANAVPMALVVRASGQFPAVDDATLGKHAKEYADEISTKGNAAGLAGFVCLIASIVILGVIGTTLDRGADKPSVLMVTTVLLALASVAVIAIVGHVEGRRGLDAGAYVLLLRNELARRGLPDPFVPEEAKAAEKTGL